MGRTSSSIDEDIFNPLKANIEYLNHHIESAFKIVYNDTAKIDGIMVEVKDNYWIAI